MKPEEDQRRHSASLLRVLDKENHRFRSKLLNQDLWRLEELGIQPYKHRHDYNLSFSKIEQPWLKMLAKKYVLLKISRGAKSGTLQGFLTTINRFSRFLQSRFISSVEEIDNETLLGFISHLRLNLKHTTAHGTLSTLKVFLDSGSSEEWFQISTTVLKNKIPPRRVSSNEIETIPDYVLEQLDQNLHFLPSPIQRIVILIRTLGLRIGEVLTLPVNCLRERKDGEFELQISSLKSNGREDYLPILPELKCIVREQQNYIERELGSDWPYLFCGNKKGGFPNTKRENSFCPDGKVMSASSFARWLNKLEVKDFEGKIWHFKTHQFRRTVATKLLEANVRHYIISKYLRHLSPEMIQNYAYISPKLQKELVEIQKNRRVIDVSGKHIEFLYSDLDKDISLEWLRSRMQPKALPMGFCARPDLLKPCPHVNACLSCQHYRLDESDLPALRDHLKRTQILRNEGELKNYWRQVDGIKKDEETLERIIDALEKKQ